MKKYIIALGLSTTLLFAHAGNACSIYVQVHNNTGDYLKHVDVFGPWKRSSKTYKMHAGDSFTYHAVGSVFSCHGWYYVGGGDNLISDLYGLNRIYERKDGTIVAHIIPNPTHNSRYRVVWSHA